MLSKYETQFLYGRGKRPVHKGLLIYYPKFVYMCFISLPGREVEHSHEAAEEAAGGVRGRVSTRHGCSQEAAARAG